VRNAFEIGRAAVLTDPSIPEARKEVLSQPVWPIEPGQVEKFQLLPSSSGHTESLLDRVLAGPWTDTTRQPKFHPSKLPSAPEDFVGRVVDLYTGELAQSMGRIGCCSGQACD